MANVSAILNVGRKRASISREQRRDKDALIHAPDFNAFLLVEPWSKQHFSKLYEIPAVFFHSTIMMPQQYLVRLTLDLLLLLC